MKQKVEAYHKEARVLCSHLNDLEDHNMPSNKRCGRTSQW
jgi:hypothetical protein